MLPLFIMFSLVLFTLPAHGSYLNSAIFSKKCVEVVATPSIWVNAANTALQTAKNHPYITGLVAIVVTTEIASKISNTLYPKEKQKPVDLNEAIKKINAELHAPKAPVIPKKGPKQFA